MSSRTSIQSPTALRASYKRDLDGDKPEVVVGLAQQEVVGQALDWKDGAFS